MLQRKCQLPLPISFFLALKQTLTLHCASELPRGVGLGYEGATRGPSQSCSLLQLLWRRLTSAFRSYGFVLDLPDDCRERMAPLDRDMLDCWWLCGSELPRPEPDFR